jgi:hypothetical protein
MIAGIRCFAEGAQASGTELSVSMFRNPWRRGVWACPPPPNSIPNPLQPSSPLLQTKGALPKIAGFCSICVCQGWEVFPGCFSAVQPSLRFPAAVSHLLGSFALQRACPGMITSIPANSEQSTTKTGRMRNRTLMLRSSLVPTAHHRMLQFRSPSASDPSTDAVGFGFGQPSATPSLGRCSSAHASLLRTPYSVSAASVRTVDEALAAFRPRRSPSD